jgi:flagellar biosynthesis GTPase FlhF
MADEKEERLERELKQVHRREEESEQELEEEHRREEEIERNLEKEHRQEEKIEEELENERRRHRHEHVLLIFIINGAEFPLETNINSSLKEAVARALSESGNTGRPPSEWQVRDANGVLLEVERKIKDLGFSNGTRLFLTLAVGAGGCGN